MGLMKPFKPPAIVARTPSNNAALPPLSSEPPTKKRRLSDESNANAEANAAAAHILKKPKSVSRFQPLAQKPVNVRAASSTPQHGEQEGYYTVLWRKFTNKKNKTWDGDGILAVSGGYATLQDISGRVMGRTACKGPLLVGSPLSIGGKEIEVESMISKEDFLAGRPFLGTTAEFTPKPTLGPASQASKSGFKMPMLDHTQLVPKKAKKDTSLPTPRHDPTAPGALVMKRPPSVPNGKRVVDVVMDPLLSRHLREHQRVGVAFLYECVMGMKSYDGEGAILADEMGLGKTLQTIALLWTLLKQSPIYEEAPVIKKALIVCPVTLINNWRKEFRKWLGNERIGVFVAESNKTRLTDFTKGKSYSVMIIGYEKLRLVQADLQQGGIDIVIADEGHRLKTAQNKSAQAIKSLNTERRIILSGTPIQNDLAEFHTMVDFVNPGLLSKYTTFKREFEAPILKSQQPGATANDLEKGEARSEELATITGKFILRRTAEILAKYLPPKTEYVVYCRPTKLQAEVYRAIIGSPVFSAALGSASATLELINVLKKVCNSPNLLLKKGSKGEDSTKPGLLECVPSGLLKTPGASGKLSVLDELLHQIKTTTSEKVVLVSNYTSTLDVLEKLVDSLSYNYLRLDGNTPPAKRQDLVDRFNRSPPSNSFVFLLSAKAGGVGLNLIGASRLILFDLDWNPATDLQAMARVHRDGQKRPCYIYRLLTKGALDEKIFQRQVSKMGLADSIVDGKSSASGFTRDELRDLFTLDESDHCQTHELLGCSCGANGMPLALPTTEDDDDALRNDLATLGSRDDDGVEVLRLDQDEDDVPLEPRLKPLTSASVNMEEQEAEIRRKAKECKDSAGRTKMLSLMQYTHFDTTNNSPLPTRKSSPTQEGEDSAEEYVSEMDPLEAVVEDAALRRVLRDPLSRIAFLLAKVSS